MTAARPPRPLAKTAKAALDFFLGATSGTAHWQRALRALTLFMLQGHAPRFFARHRLERAKGPALARLALVPRALPLELGALDAMSRLDAAWVEWASGRTPALPDAAQARAFVAAAKARDGVLWAWVLGELGEQLGLGARLEGLGERPLEGGSEEEVLYWLSHQVLFATRYLSRPLPPGSFAAEAQALGAAVGPLKVVGDADLLAEVAFCLQAIGEPWEPAVEALAPFVGERGQVGKETGYLGAHRAAAAAVALAGAVERAR